jgi:uncharacterized membrane protein HdeD (DUF308 family)
MTRVTDRLTRLYVRPEGRPPRSEVIAYVVLGGIGLVFVASGIVDNFVALVVVGALLVVAGIFRASLLVLALRTYRRARHFQQ